MKKHVILCPVDYSESTEVAISVAIDLAKASNSKVFLLHVIEPNVAAVSVRESLDNQFQLRLRKQYLEFYDVDYECMTRRGDPAEITIAYAQANEVDLIVMGTQGRTGLAGLLVGSVARKVMADANCPVVTVKVPSHHKVGSWHDPVIPLPIGAAT